MYVNCVLVYLTVLTSNYTSDQQLAGTGEKSPKNIYYRPVGECLNREAVMECTAECTQNQRKHP